MNSNAKYLRFLSELSEVMQAIRLRQFPDRVDIILNRLNNVWTEFNSCEADIDYHLNGEYLTKPSGKKIKLLDFYIRCNLLTRIAHSVDSEIEDMFDEIFEDAQQNWWHYLDEKGDDLSFAQSELSPNAQTYLWLKILFSGNNHSDQIQNLIDYESNPWYKQEIALSPIEFPKNSALPRIRMAPWRFRKPEDSEIAEAWMTEESYWTIPPELITTIISKTNLVTRIKKLSLGLLNHRQRFWKNSQYFGK